MSIIAIILVFSAGCISGPTGGSDNGTTGQDTLTPSPTTADQQSTTHPNYERCESRIVDYDELPEPAQEEVRAATNARYETNDLTLRRVVDISEAYIRYQNTTYEIQLTVGDSGSEDQKTATYILTLVQAENTVTDDGTEC